MIEPIRSDYRKHELIKVPSASVRLIFNSQFINGFDCVLWKAAREFVIVHMDVKTMSYINNNMGSQRVHLLVNYDVIMSETTFSSIHLFIKTQWKTDANRYKLPGGELPEHIMHNKRWCFVWKKSTLYLLDWLFYIRSHLKGQQTSSSLWMSFCINAFSDCVQHIIYNWFWEKVYWDKDEYRTCNLFCLVHCFAFHKILNTISDNGTRMKKKCNSIIIMLVNQHLTTQYNIKFSSKW